MPEETAVKYARITSAEDEILEAVAKSEAENFSEPMSAETLRRYISLPHFGLYILTAADGSLLAHLATTEFPPEMQIDSLAATIKRRGYGNMLLGYVLADAKARGFTSATLEVRESNKAARRLYLKYGFNVVATRKKMYNKPAEDGLGMKAEL